MVERRLLGGVLVARVFGALAYISSIVLFFGAAVLTATQARVAFIFVFIPGVLLAVLSPFVWSGSRSAMILALAVSVVIELMIAGNDPANWWPFLAVPVTFGVLVALALGNAPLGRDAGAAGRVFDEVYAAVTYFSGLLAAFMAPFNHSHHLGWTGTAGYALSVGVVAGVLSLLIWRGSTSAMIATFALSLAHWLVLAGFDASLRWSIPHLAAPVASGILTVACVAAAKSKSA